MSSFRFLEVISSWTSQVVRAQWHHWLGTQILRLDSGLRAHLGISCLDRVSRGVLTFIRCFWLSRLRNSFSGSCCVFCESLFMANGTSDTTTTVVTVFLRGGQINLLIGISIMIFAAVLVFVGKQINSVVTESLRLQF